MSEETTIADGARNITIVYVLYLAGIILGLTSIIGVVMAYLSRDEADGWLKSHYQFQIRTFWIGALYGVIVIPLLFVGIGILLIPVILIWYIVRCVKGLMAVSKHDPIQNPQSWLFG